MIKEWEKRNVIKLLMESQCTDSLQYTAGTKNGESVLKVFLREDHEFDARNFRKKCNIENIIIIIISDCPKNTTSS